MRIEEKMIKLLGTLFYVKLPICSKSCYVSQEILITGFVLENFSVMRMLTLDYWQGFLEYPILIIIQQLY